MMKKNIYITIVPDIVDEGGMARNRAFFEFLKNRENIHILNLRYTNNFLRIFQTFYLSYLLLFFRKKNIFIHETVLVSLFPLKLFKYNFFVYFFARIIRSNDKNNHLFIEINDLPFEQARDLGLKLHLGQKNFQKAIFNLERAQYAFASNLMKEYTVGKYKIINRCEIIINAGPELRTNKTKEVEAVKALINEDKISYVYCGTLNKGRQIEKIMEIFSFLNKSSQLFLLGAEGEWIKSFETSKNIHYLGNFDENTAHSIVSLFSVGLVPYDNTKFYYNICYPTKISFYLTAGLPVVCTPLRELQYWFSNKKYLIFEDIENWNNFFCNLDKRSIYEFGRNLNTIEYTWENILEKSGINNFFHESSDTFSNIQ